MRMAEAMRQMLVQCRWEGVASSEAASDPFSDVAKGLPYVYRHTGLAESMAGTRAQPELESETSSSRAARCRPACQVVRHGCLL